jgi:hypothetical protein
MNFRLPVDNRGQPDDVLLEDLRIAADRAGVSVLTREAYETYGRFSPATIAKRFGGWGRAVERAGLLSARHFSVSREEAIADLQRVATESGTGELSLSEYRKHGRYSEKPFLHFFGRWKNALQAAGLTLSKHHHERISDDELFANLANVWQSLGRAPTVNDMLLSVSKYSVATYKARFKGWRRALEEFVVWAQGDRSDPPERVARARTPVLSRRRRSRRDVGVRLRFVVLRRDDFTCRSCGNSPALERGLVLHVDHVIPWEKGGETELENLQTLCQACNLGKSNVL